MNEQVTYLAICNCGSIVGCISCEEIELREYQTVVSNWMRRGLSIVPGTKTVDPQQCACRLPPAEKKISMKALRDQLGMTQPEFSNFLGMGVTTIQKLEYGTSKGRAAHKTLTDLCLRFPVVIKLIKIFRGMDIDENQCKLCGYSNKCSTKGGPNCQLFKPAG